MTTLIKQAQQLNEQEQYAISTLTEIAAQHNITYVTLCEDVLSVLANLSQTAKDGKGLTVMGGNVLNYAYFLAGLQAIVRQMTNSQKPSSEQTKAKVLKVLAGLNISGGIINYSCQQIVDLGARPELAPLVQFYEKRIKSMNTDPIPLVNALGLLSLSMNKIRGPSSPNTTVAPGSMRSRLSPDQTGTLPPAGAVVNGK